MFERATGDVPVGLSLRAKHVVGSGDQAFRDRAYPLGYRTHNHGNELKHAIDIAVPCLRSSIRGLGKRVDIFRRILWFACFFFRRSSS